MAQEAKRGCGYRQVGGMYLVNDGLMHTSCDRLPYPLTCCPVCDTGFKSFRGVKKISTVGMFDRHVPCEDKTPCPLCEGLNFTRTHLLDEEQHIVDVGDYLMCVGERFYPKSSDFMTEALNVGVSKRISSIPKNLIVGHSWVFLAHPSACKVTLTVEDQAEELTIYETTMGSGKQAQRLIDAPKVVDQMGIFAFFIPTRIEMPVWKGKTSSRKRKALEKRGITLIEFDYDPDHDPNKKKKRKRIAFLGKGKER